MLRGRRAGDEFLVCVAQAAAVATAVVDQVVAAGTAMKDVVVGELEEVQAQATKED